MKTPLALLRRSRDVDDDMRRQHHLAVPWRTRTFVDDMQYSSDELVNNYIVKNPGQNRTRVRFLSPKKVLKKMTTTMLMAVTTSDPGRVSLKMIWKQWYPSWLPYVDVVIGWIVNGGRVFCYLKLELTINVFEGSFVTCCV